MQPDFVAILKLSQAFEKFQKLLHDIVSIDCLDQLVQDWIVVAIKDSKLLEKLLEADLTPDGCITKVQ